MVSQILNGSFVGVPARIKIDHTVPSSVLSLSFAGRHNIPRSVIANSSSVQYTASGPVVLATTQGWIHSTQPFHVSFMTDCDVLLGQDWVSACQPTLSYGYLQPPSAETVSKWPCGHIWMPRPSHGMPLSHRLRRNRVHIASLRSPPGMVDDGTFVFLLLCCLSQTHVFRPRACLVIFSTILCYSFRYGCVFLMLFSYAFFLHYSCTLRLRHFTYIVAHAEMWF